MFGTVGANLAPGVAGTLELARTEVVGGQITTAQSMAAASEKNVSRYNFANATGLPRRTGFSAAFLLWFLSFNLIALPDVRFSGWYGPTAVRLAVGRTKPGGWRTH
jgi:hypothetical protein